MDNIKVLIVSFYFPPYPKVGGRRWAKFAKYLNRDGVDTHVLCLTFNQDNGKLGPWNKDVEEFNEKIYRIRKEFVKPYHLRTLPKNIVQKIKWKLSIALEKYKKKKYSGNYSDPGREYAVEVKNKTAELIQEHGFSTVIVTGGPFTIPFEVVKLKNKFSKVKFIVDIRDNWTGGVKNLLSNSQLKAESSKEELTYKRADNILTCASYILEDINSRYNLVGKVHHIKHAYDLEDFSPEIFKKQKLINSDSVEMVYAGTLYVGMEKEVYKLTEFLRFLKMKGLVPRVRLFCFNGGYENIIEDSDVSDCFVYENIVTPLELSKVFSDSTYILQLRPKSEEGWENFLSSKFYELLLYRKPILYFGPSGTVQQFLENKKLGIWIDSYSDDTDFDQLYNQLLKNEIPTQSYDVSKHEFREEVKKLKEILKP